MVRNRRSRPTAKRAQVSHGRLQAAPAPEIVGHVNDLMMSNSLHAFSGLLRYHLAYVAMLVDGGLLPSPNGAVLLRALLELGSKGTGVLCVDSARYEELQPAVEAWLIRKAGAGAGGQLNAGRSRQECQMVAEQVVLRDALLTMTESLVAFAAAADATGTAESDAALGATVKSMPRLFRSYREVNTSRAGVGSVVPTSLPIDREMLARLLGFVGCLQNSLYGYSAFDIEITLLNALQLLAADLHHVAHALPASATAQHTDLPGHLALTMRDAQRAHMAATNLYLDTTPAIRGSITFSTYDCLMMVERIGAALAMMSQAIGVSSERGAQTQRPPTEWAGPQRSLRQIARWKRCVADEKLRLRRASSELQRRICHAAQHDRPAARKRVAGG